jgi:plastocyanin
VFRNAPRRSLLAIAATMSLLLAACAPAETSAPAAGNGGNGGNGEPPADCVRVENGVINISAENLEFSAPCMVANAGEAFTIAFDNQDDGQMHNVAVYQDDSKANEIMRGDIIQGPAQAEYEVEALEAGEYYFDCTVHPNMNGTLYVVEA